MKKRVGIIFLALLLGMFSVITVRAVTISVGIPVTQSGASGATGPGGTILNFYDFALFISGILAFGAIVWGGIKYALAAGNPSGQSEGKQWIQGALVGILLLAGAYIILKTINPALISLNIPQLSKLPQPAATQLPAGYSYQNSNATDSVSAFTNSLTNGPTQATVTGANCGTGASAIICNPPKTCHDTDPLSAPSCS